MTSEIQTRINQIKNSQTPEGYKKTSLGIIPNEWEIKKMSQILHNVERPVKKPLQVYTRLGIRSHAKGTFHELVEDPSKVAMDTLFVVKENDFILNITIAWEHAIALADKNDDGMLVSHRFPTYVFDKSNPVFYKYLFSRDIFRQHLDLISPGGAGRNRVLNKSDFLKLNVYFPPLPEQKKIAEILSTQDRPIELKEKFLAEKQKHKKYLMQQLLSGKLRVGNGKWKTVKLGLILKIGHGKDYKHLKKGNIPVYGTGGYMTSVDSFLYDGETVCIGRKGTIDKPLYFKGKIWTVDTLFYTYGFKNVCVKYAYYLFCNIDWKKYNEATGLPSLSKVIIENIFVNLPPLPEQNAIAEILSTSDKEIELLQKDIEQEKLKKKSLMQLLITGIVRVKT